MQNSSSGRLAAAIFHAALRAADPYRLVKERMDDLTSLYHAKHCRRLILAAFGKAALPMTRALADGAPDILSGGIVITKDGYGHPAGLPPSIAVCEASHPVPDVRGVHATERAMRLLRDADGEALVVCLISGGGSALLVAPQEGTCLEEKQAVTRELLRSGANIRELNTVRKHLSRIKGGRLMELAYPATVVSLILSDVIDDPLDVIASGPTTPDGTTFREALAVLDHYGLRQRVPPACVDLLLRGRRGEIPETPKEENPIFTCVHNTIIGNSKKAVAAAAIAAKEMGYEATILSAALQGEAKDAGRRLARRAVEACRQSARAKHGKRALVSGGETTVTVTGPGMGGRNMELALAFAREIRGIEDITLLSAGTDGEDGPTDAAGAIVDGGTVERGETTGLRAEDCLRDNDSYRFLQAAGDLFRTGPTGTNVMDVQIILIDG